MKRRVPFSEPTKRKKAKSCASCGKKKMLVVIAEKDDVPTVLTVKGDVKICDALVRALEISQSEKLAGAPSSRQHMDLVANFLVSPPDPRSWLTEQREENDAENLRSRIRNYFGFDSEIDVAEMEYEVTEPSADNIEMMGDVNFYKVIFCYAFY
jgi:hypothetical protein